MHAQPSMLTFAVPFFDDISRYLSDIYGYEFILEILGELEKTFVQIGFGAFQLRQWRTKYLTACCIAHQIVDRTYARLSLTYKSTYYLKDKIKLVSELGKICIAES